jgi:hypothetical protein
MSVFMDADRSGMNLRLASPAAMALENWVECYDETYRSPYYYNLATGISQWDIPQSNDRTDSGMRRGNWNDSEEDIDCGDKKVCSPPSMPEHMVMFVDQGDYADRLANLQVATQFECHFRQTCYYSDMDSGGDDDDNGTSSAGKYKVTYIPYEEERVVYPMVNARTELDVSTPQNLNQDYVHLAQIYRIQRPYMETGTDIPCVLCRRNSAKDVFFPCEHRCVCRECIRKENISDDMSISAEKLDSGDSFCNCPLCGSTIKKILPCQNGFEKDLYWKWATEITPPLPKGFMKDFKHSAGVIEAVFSDTGGKVRRRTKGQQCVLS